jgi:phosphatidylglycerol---prolipoprotein diacylglyceryl transferase
MGPGHGNGPGFSKEAHKPMRQVLFYIPLHQLSDGLPNIPIFGYGTMLFVAFVACTWLAGRLCLRQGIQPQFVQDLAIWIFVVGIIGARITFMVQYRLYEGRSPFEVLVQFIMIWEGGLVFYGSAIGGAVGYVLAYFFVLRRHHVSSWKMADVIAPCVPLGLALGRVGCLLNGCCYGDVACADCPAIHFPLSAPPRYHLVARGYQTAAGFTTTEMGMGDRRTVDKVEPGSAADQGGLKPGDLIVKVNGRDVQSYEDLKTYLGDQEWPRGKNDLVLGVKRQTGSATAASEITLPAFSPQTIGLHPTQVYETISMLLLLGVMLAYWPFRRRDGELMVIFMLAYAIHRYLNEILRNDTKPVFADMTLSQNGSILMLLGGLLLWVWVWLRAPRHEFTPPDTPGEADKATTGKAAAASSAS